MRHCFTVGQSVGPSVSQSVGQPTTRLPAIVLSAQCSAARGLTLLALAVVEQIHVELAPRDVAGVALHALQGEAGE